VELRDELLQWFSYVKEWTKKGIKIEIENSPEQML
jgi:hypothetical protein